MSDKPNSPPTLKWALDGREIDIFNRSDIKEILGNPKKVLAAIDDYHDTFKPHERRQERTEEGSSSALKKNPEMVAVATQLVDLACLRDYVRIAVGASHEVLRELVTETKKIETVEMIFIDHWQDFYRPDLWLLEELGALKPGKSVVLADNKKQDIVSKSAGGFLKPNPNLVYGSRVQEFLDTNFGLDGVAITYVKETHGA
ncbi:S-adenosyl-L-methionine-dependent methyltransferase [Aspergillus affinis]|uniref:S-adenosyl-L-methionine-dependent methyltransferase n=1 Tax=Aspergillus affinis TaxID=1070780 RepID=UPI0022FE2C76|nr:S-adenosyl-L-methionine-dependent methyltransferase [Aspergillus affinis]KAI9038586.1 S-adenosyl-L-methionine-dependent methyltransferase [Aspergillus affinis]